MISPSTCHYCLIVWSEDLVGTAACCKCCQQSCSEEFSPGSFFFHCLELVLFRFYPGMDVLVFYLALRAGDLCNVDLYELPVLT
jgi:hypothetical protein